MFNHLDKGDTSPVDQPSTRRSPPTTTRGAARRCRESGPAANGPDAVAFVRAFFEPARRCAAICHGPWTLVEADVVATGP